MSCGVSTFTALSNDEHRVKRSRLNPFFSRKKVLELENSVQERAQRLCAIVAKRFALNQAVDIHHGFRAVSVDVITAYAFNQCYNLLDKKDLGMEFFFMMQRVGPMMWVFQQWPFFQKIALSMPQSIAAAMSPPMKQLFNVQAVRHPPLLLCQFKLNSLINNCLALPPVNCLCKG
jgi:cytochrome P450